MDGDWARLARQLAFARKLMGLTQAQLADALGVGESSVQKMERPSAKWAKVSPIHRLAATFYGWTANSIDLVLAGGDPVKSGEPASLGSAAQRGPERDSRRAALEALTEGMSPRAIEALTRGRTVDTVVVDLAPDDPDATAVLIYKRGDDSEASTEEKRRVLRKWAKLQRAALEIFSEDE